MISGATFADRVESRRCVIEGTTLAPGEAVVSSRAAPHLYGANAPGSSQRIVDELIATSITLLQNATPLSDLLRGEVRKFWSRIVRKSDASQAAAREAVVHNYLFYYWADIWEHSDCEPLDIDEKYIPQNQCTWDPESAFSSRLGGRFRKEAPVDIVARGGSTLFLVEVKFDDVDDRAIGQLLRYFETGRFLCNHVDHLCDLRTVVPVLVVRDFPESQWSALSSPFRELIRVFFFREDDERLTLVDGRSQLRARTASSRRYLF